MRLWSKSGSLLIPSNDSYLSVLFPFSWFQVFVHKFITLFISILKKSTFNGIWFSINSKLNIFQNKINIVMLAHVLCIHWSDSNLSQNFKSRLYIEWMCLLSNKMLTMVDEPNNLIYLGFDNVKMGRYEIII